MFYSDEIVAIYSVRPDTTMKELKAKLGTRFPPQRFVLRFEAEQKRSDASLVEARQTKINPYRSVFHNETLAKTNTIRLVGRSLINAQLADSPYGR